MPLSTPARAAIAGAGGLASLAGTALLAVAVDGVNSLLRPSPMHHATERVIDSDAETVTLARTEAALRPGVYGLWWQASYVVLGAVTDTDATTVTRMIRPGGPVETRRAAIDRAVWASDPRQARGLPYVDVTPRGETGPLPSWYVDGNHDTFAILVHGQGGDRRRCLRAMRAFADVRLPQVVMSWRNDGVAGPSPDRRHHLGASEWQDLDAVAGWALDNGARHLLLYGMSTAGAIIGAFLDRSRHAERVRAVALDAPVLDWRPVLRAATYGERLPAGLARLPELVTRRRIGLDFDAFDFVARHEVFDVPVLILHGTDDTTVPIECSRAFAAAAGSRARLEQFPGAGHEQAWNTEPRRYGAVLREWLAEVINSSTD